MKWMDGVVAGALAALAIGCAKDDGKDVHTFHDAQQHTCTVDSGDLTATAACDIAASIVCLSGQQPVWEVAPDLDSTDLQVCQGCKSDASHATAIAAETCIDVICQTAADCIYGSATCDAGICKQP